MEITVIRSKRKTISIRINPDLSITVRAPRYATQKDIERALRQNESWICRHMEQMKKKKEQYERLAEEKLTPEETRMLADQALKIIPGRVEYFAGKACVTYGRITIRNQKTRWGSCSSKGNLNFNCLLMLAPPAVLDYVVVHELCHRKEMNHSKAFWAEVEKILPDYRDADAWLKAEGSRIMQRHT